MEKQTAQQELQAEEPRRLNMEEKRKLEKLLIADIDSALARYDAVTKQEREALVERLEQNIPCNSIRSTATCRSLAIRAPPSYLSTIAHGHNIKIKNSPD